MLTISTAFAAPLLHFVNYPSFALCIYAPSRSGKTGVTYAAASVIGLTNIITWNTTVAALEQSFAISNDCMLPIDDLSGKPGSAKTLYGEFRELAHLITSGSGKKRHNYFGSTTGVGHDSWRTIAITSREDSISNLAKQLRREREIGEAVRLIDVPALFPGHNNIFDRAKAPLKANQVTARLGCLYKACATEQGHVFELYIAKLAKRRDKLEERVNALTEDFIKQNILESDENVFRDLATKFGIIYAGGHLATEFGLTGWSKKELRDAISKAFAQAKTHFPDPTENLKRGLSALRTALDALPTKKKAIDERLFGGISGYRTTFQNKTAFVIQVHKFTEIFETAEQVNRILEFLREHKFINMKRRKAGRERTSPKEQFIWPDEKRRRSYRLVLPGIDDWKACLKVRRKPAK